MTPRPATTTTREAGRLRRWWDDRGVRLEVVVLGTLGAINALQAVVHRRWYADGSAFLLTILTTGSFFDFGWTRIAALDVTQLPVVVARRLLGIDDVATLSVLLGLGLFGHRVLALALCAVALGRRSAWLWCFPAFSLLVTDPATSFFVVSEAHFAASAYWVTWSALVRRERFGIVHGALLVVYLAFFATRRRWCSDRSSAGSRFVVSPPARARGAPSGSRCSSGSAWRASPSRWAPWRWSRPSRPGNRSDFFGAAVVLARNLPAWSTAPGRPTGSRPIGCTIRGGCSCSWPPWSCRSPARSPAGTSPAARPRGAWP
ncbi:MAG: hypothetical protein KIT14_04195 [bacterium]|nr:hypothetical protein [bacterium]